MGDVHYIVEKLSAPPFNYQLDLVRFAEKSSNDLLQIISDVFSAISTKHAKVDVAKDGVDHAVDRITNFLRIVKYKPTVDGATFRQLLGAGDKGVMYHVLKWVLPQAGVLEKRAVVGYFMSLPDMPEELNYDADVMELKEEIKQLQAEFVEASWLHAIGCICCFLSVACYRASGRFGGCTVVLKCAVYYKGSLQVTGCGTALQHS